MNKMNTGGIAIYRNSEVRPETDKTPEGSDIYRNKRLDIEFDPAGVVHFPGMLFSINIQSLRD